MEKKQTFPYLGKLKGLAIVMVILQLLYGIMMSKTNGEPYDLVWYSYSSIPVALACTVIFLRNYQINVNPLMMRLLRLIGSNTLGILLLHRFVGASLYPWYQGLSCSDRIIPNLIFAAVICVVSLGATLLLKKVPVLRRLFYI